MNPAQPAAGRGTLTSSQRSHSRPHEGAVTGHLFKILRERMPLTQVRLAELLDVDVSTVQGWESGRRPLPAVPSSHLLFLRRRLLRAGADPALLVLLDVAMDADSIIAYTLAGDPSSATVAGHPLSGWVFNRTATHMIAWALTGARPAALPDAPVDSPRRRGPSPTSPILPDAARKQFFAHMRRAAEMADHAGEEGALLRRQAVYLCSYDTAPDTRGWLADIQSRRPVRLDRSTWSPEWADARSLATSLTRYGELDLLRDFIRLGVNDDAGEIANLNYWAYWLGLDSLPRADDSFMVDSPPWRWDAGALLRSIADRLDPDLGCVDLNIHSVWSLLAYRPGLPSIDPQLVDDLRCRVTRLLDSGAASQQARRELDQVHYGLKLNAH